MNNRLEILIEKLYDSVLHEDFKRISNNIIKELEEIPNAFDAIEPILKLMEANPNVDFGMPGPLVHFVEKFYKNGYEEKLIYSLQRQPTNPTVWMLNRIINGSGKEQKNFYIEVLENIAVSQTTDESVKLLAQHFKSLNI